jgi:hypothetical protein
MNSNSSQELKTAELPENIYAIEYAGFWDFSSDGFYGPSFLNVEDYPNAEQIAEEIARRYNSHAELIEENKRLKEASQWIGVEERLPEFYKTVIVEGGIAYLNKDNDLWYSVSGINYPGFPIKWEVTHWMPVPTLKQSLLSNKEQNCAHSFTEGSYL